VADASFDRPDLTTFCRLDVVGQHLEPTRAVSPGCVLEPDRWCHRCGCEGTPRDSVLRRLAHEPLGWRPTTLLVTIRRYQCTGGGHVSRQDTSRAAASRAKLSRRGLRWASEAIVCQHLDRRAQHAGRPSGGAPRPTVVWGRTPSHEGADPTLAGSGDV
jgi:hypothetical protein